MKSTCLVFVLLTSSALATKPGQVTTPYPTITNLAVDGLIEGDDYLNAKCDAIFRVKGMQKWYKAMPMQRVAAGESQKTSPIVEWTNRLSGSILDHEPFRAGCQLGFQLVDRSKSERLAP